MRGGAALLEVCIEIEAKRKNILRQLSSEEREKAEYIFGILDKLSVLDNSFVHSLFLAGAVLMILAVPRLVKEEIGPGLLFALLISAAIGIISHKTINYFYYDRKCARLSKELADKMAADTVLKEVFWKIRQDCHSADIELTNRIWKEGISK